MDAIRRQSRTFWLIEAGRCWACALIVLALGGSGAVAGTSDNLVDVWTVENGLPNSSVTAIAQTPEGYLWVGTLNGLARFDGVRFTVFDPLNTPELKHARVYGLFVATNGTLWINTYDGPLTSWRDGQFNHEWQGWAGLQMVRMFTRSNDLVFTMGGGELVSREGTDDSPGNWRRFKPAQLATGFSYAQDASGIIWYHTRDGAVGWLTGTNAHLLPPDCGLAGQWVNCLESDRSGNIWVGTDKGIAVWDGHRFQDRTPTNHESPVNVSFLFFTRDDACWTVANNRVRKFVERQWVAEAQGWGELFGTYLLALVANEDHQGGTWFCHYGQGVFHAKADGDTPGSPPPTGCRATARPAGFRIEKEMCGWAWIGVDWFACARNGSR